MNGMMSIRLLRNRRTGKTGYTQRSHIHRDCMKNWRLLQHSPRVRRSRCWVRQFTVQGQTPASMFIDADWFCNTASVGYGPRTATFSSTRQISRRRCPMQCNGFSVINWKPNTVANSNKASIPSSCFETDACAQARRFSLSGVRYPGYAHGTGKAPDSYVRRLN